MSKNDYQNNNQNNQNQENKSSQNSQNSQKNSSSNSSNCKDSNKKEQRILVDLERGRPCGRLFRCQKSMNCQAFNGLYIYKK